MRWVMLIVGIMLGVLLLGAARFLFVPPPQGVHYHANFAVFVDGERLDLSGDRFMEDVAACAADPDAVRPEDRVHLHDNNPDVVHVHHGGATWGHLFANLGLGLGEDYLVLPDGRRLFDGEDGRTMELFVDGRQLPEIHNRAVAPRDRALVSIGPETPDEVLERQFPQVASNAAEYDETSDPAGCAGAHRELTLRQRLEHAFWGG